VSLKSLIEVYDKISGESMGLLRAESCNLVKVFWYFADVVLFISMINFMVMPLLVKNGENGAKSRNFIAVFDVSLVIHIPL